MEDIMDEIRLVWEMPSWAFWPLVLIALAMIVIVERFFSKHSPSKIAVAGEARIQALRMDGVAYFVKKVQIVFPFGVNLRLVTADQARKKTTLPFPRGHPDYLKARMLLKLNRIEFEFEFSGEPLPGVDPGEICAYLRLGR